MKKLFIIAGTLLFLPVAHAVQEQCMETPLQGASQARACVDVTNCYYDERAVHEGRIPTCVNYRQECEEIADEADEIDVWGAVYGYLDDQLEGKGRVRIQDYCVGKVLHQVYCRIDERVGYRKQYTCPLGCSDGICIEDEDENDIDDSTCSDSDGGRIYFETGFTNEHNFQRDTCLNAQTLREMICENDQQQAVLFTCPHRCVAGRCSSIELSLENPLWEDENNTLILTLSSEPTTALSIRHAFQFGSNPSFELNLPYDIEGTILTMSDIQSLLTQEKNGEGMYQLMLAVCPESGQFYGEGITDDCGPTVSFSFYHKPVVASVSPPSSEQSSSSSVSFSSSSSTSSSMMLTNPFPDTTLETRIGRAAQELHSRGIIGGFPDGTFRGSAKVNRAEAAKMMILARFGAVQNRAYRNRFSDVSSDAWYTPYIANAADFNIIEGHPDGTFRPADTVNTAEFLAMIVRAFGLQKEKLQYSYTDVKPSDWFADYAGIAEHRNLFPDRVTKLKPGQLLTRQDVAVALYQYLMSQ